MGTRQQNPVPSNISDSSPPPDLATESYNVILEQLDRAIGEIVEKIESGCESGTRSTRRFKLRTTGFGPEIETDPG